MASTMLLGRWPQSKSFSAESWVKRWQLKRLISPTLLFSSSYCHFSKT